MTIILIEFRAGSELGIPLYIGLIQERSSLRAAKRPHGEESETLPTLPPPPSPPTPLLTAL